MYKHIVFPKEENLEQVMHIIVYMKKHNKSILMFDYSNTTVSES